MDKYDIKRSPYHFSIRRPVTATMIVLTAVVFGYLSYRLLPINMMPDITYPSITVRTEYPGSAPEEVESTITRPLEQSLGVVRDLVEMSSSSRAEYSDVLLEFAWDVDMNRATQDVREKLDLVFLPEGVKEPLILRYDPSLDPLLRIGLTSDSLGPVSLRKISEDLLKQEFEKIKGVAAAKVKGGDVDEIRVAVRSASLDMLNIPIERLIQRLSAENINIAGGRINEGESEFIVRTLNEFQSVEEIGEISIIHSDGKTIRLDDVAEVRRTSKEKTSLTRFAESESVEIEIFKESEANPIAVSDLVKKRIFGWEKKQGLNISFGEPQEESKKGGLRPLQETLTDNIKIYILSDQAEFIRLAVNEVKVAAILGGILAIGVLLIFLGRLRDTLVVAIVIPISLVCTFAAMHIFGISVNVMSLGGLALGIGMMVDNAIVVIESIYRRKEQGEGAVESAVNGTRIVGGAVTASTLTTVVVFFPIVFVTGIAGQIFGDMALTVIISLVVSLFVALFFIPMLVSLRFNRDSQKDNPVTWETNDFHFIRCWENLKSGFKRWAKLNLFLKILTFIVVLYFLVLRFLFELILRSLHWVAISSGRLIRKISTGILRTMMKWSKTKGKSTHRNFQKMFGVITSFYLRVLSSVLRHPISILLIMVLMCFFAYGWVLPQMGGELIPSVSQGMFEVEFTFPTGTTLEKTSRAILPIEKDLMKMQGIKSISSRSGGDPTGTQQSGHGSNFAIMTVSLESGGDIDEREARAIERVHELAANIPSLRILVSYPTLFTFKQPVELILKGDDLAKLRILANRISSDLENLSILRDVESSVRRGNPEAVVKFDRDRLSMLGLNPRSAAERVRSAVLGVVPTRFREEERRVDIRVQFSEKDRESLENLRNLVINPDQLVPVTLSEVASIQVLEGPAEVRRADGIRAAVITAGIENTDLKTADIAIRDVLSDYDLREGYDYLISGQRREMDESLGSLRLALMLAIFLVYVVMASQFESFKSPFLILLTVPLAVAAVIPVLWGFGIPISVMVFLGLIVLVGIVVNDSIVFVDYTNQVFRSGETVRNAIQTAAGARFRPIIMTTLTTILALLPMAIGVGEGVEIRRPMAVTVIFGLSFSTMITLIVIPVLYRLMHKDKS
ncbi:MAG: efflux RND transporter permease subunit [Calditrichaeota bacterium]|nr:efflux RND transporter permease subunit [Calditrichota bacterium]